MSASAIIQARMNSSRFYGKMLVDIAGKPVLWHVIHRLRKCTQIDQIILATSSSRCDDPLAVFADTQGITVVRGSDDNVLQRFVAAVKETGSSILVRICGDSILIDPWLIDTLVTLLEVSGQDYPRLTKPSSDCGIDVVSRHVLNRIFTEKANHSVAIENVTGYLSIDPGFGTVAELELSYQDRFVPEARFCIDTPADANFMRALYRHMTVAAGEIDFLSAIAFLKKHTELLKINAHVRQRRADECPPSVVIRCDASPTLGLGHLMRCLAIAMALRDHGAAAVTFALGGDPALAEIVRDEAFPVELIPGCNRDMELASVLISTKAHAVLMDVRTPTAASELEAIRGAGCRFAVLDDSSERRLVADLGFYPPIGHELDWHHAKGKYYAGWEWLALRPQFSSLPSYRPPSSPNALILVGGSDTQGLRARLLRAAVAGLPADWHITLVIGRATVANASFDAQAAKIGERLTIMHDVSEMASLMASSTLAVSVFGGTVYELVAVGVPTIIIGLDADHARSVAPLAETRAALFLGVAGDVSDAALTAAISGLAAHPEHCARLSVTAQYLIDGRGSQRIAECLLRDLIPGEHAESWGSGVASEMVSR